MMMLRTIDDIFEIVMHRLKFYALCTDTAVILINCTKILLPIPSCPSGMLRMHLPNMQLSPRTHWASRRQYFPSCLSGTHRPKWRSQEKPFPQARSWSQATYNQRHAFRTKLGPLHAHLVACWMSKLTMVKFQFSLYVPYSLCSTKLQYKYVHPTVFFIFIK